MKRTVVTGMALLAVLAGCEAGLVPPTAAPTPTATASPVASPSVTTATSPAPTAPEPTVGLVPFDCALPVLMPATVNRAQITDVRVGNHGAGSSGYDRIVFEFQRTGTPEVTLRAGTPPFTHDPSGLQLPVQGSSFLVLVLHGATAITPEGKMTYTGLTDFKPGFPSLTEFTQAGDFEAVSEWVAGLTGPSCHRVFVLQNPSRLVIDLQHPHG